MKKGTEFRKIEELVAKKIHEARRRKRITLAQLSEQTRISIAMLSKIENAKVSSPISVYGRIAKALEIPLGKLFSEGENVPFSFVRKGERKKYTQSAGYTGESIAFKKPNKKMEPFVHTYLPRETLPPPYQHDNEELVFVIDGDLEFRYDGVKYVLKPGDCVYFDANMKHSARALGGKAAKALVVEA